MAPGIPASGSEQRDTSDHRPPPLVWYAGYGSNLSAERFRCYLEGGVPPGLTRPCRGARDRARPRARRALDIPHRLYFAGSSRAWGGAPGFVDTVACPATVTHALAYLITWGQFEDVVAQENGGATSALALDPDDLAPGRSVPVGSGRYENLLCLGALDGYPLVTFTSPWTMEEADLGAPSPAYLEVMIAGLRASHALRDDEIVAYLGAAPGCSEELVASVLAPADESAG